MKTISPQKTGNHKKCYFQSWTGLAQRKINNLQDDFQFKKPFFPVISWILSEIPIMSRIMGRADEKRARGLSWYCRRGVISVVENLAILISTLLLIVSSYDVNFRQKKAPE
ncbi:hypothetical protein AS132_19035 [Photobacterium sanguinicancri]|nr:hypothetical protein AS132_19035 [Photobacterium sanguinicancri]